MASEISGRLAAILEAEQPMLLELRVAGVHVASLQQLLEAKYKYPDGLPILLKHLQLPYHHKTREWIARCLGRKWARNVAWMELVMLYRSEPNAGDVAAVGDFGMPSGPKDAIAIAISKMAGQDDLDTLIDLIQDRSNGPSRIFFVSNLSRSRSKTAFDTLARLSSDPDLNKEIAAKIGDKLRRQVKRETAGGAKQ